MGQTRLIPPKPGNPLSQLTTPGGNQIGYTYAHGKINTISVNGQPLLSSITYEPHGPVSGWTWGNGLPHVRARGLDGEVQRIESAVATTYGYDLAGQLNSQHLWSQTTPLQNDTQSSFSLDAAGRLTAAQTLISLPQGTISDSLAYGYDANGNRQSMIWNGIATQYAYSANRLAQSSGASNRIYAWDAAGRAQQPGTDHDYPIAIKQKPRSLRHGSGAPGFLLLAAWVCVASIPPPPGSTQRIIGDRPRLCYPSRS